MSTFHTFTMKPCFTSSLIGISQRMLCSDHRESELKLLPVQKWTHIQSLTPTVKCRGGYCVLISDSVKLTTNIL